MNRIATLTTLAAILTVTAPLSGAEWYSQGSFEPDTYLDTAAYMPQDKPWTQGADGKKTHTTDKVVYFNAFAKADALFTGGNQNGGVANPNVALLHSRFDPAGPDYTYVALLGIWADCNLDGYIGLGEQGVREYRVEILTAQLAADQETIPDACKAPTSGADVWHGTHQQNGWVTELIPILGRQNFDAGRNNIGNDLRAYYDYDAAVWGDPGLPDDSVALRTPSRCGAGVGTQPFFRHSSYTTGSILRAYDCEGTRGVVSAWNGTVGAVNGDLRFDSESRANRADRSPQNPNNPLDFSPWERCWLEADFKCDQPNDHWDNTFVRAQDCEKASSRLNPNNPLPAVGGQEGGYLYAPPAPERAVNTGGNIAGTWNRTTEEFDPIAGDQDEDDGETNSSNCNPDNEGVEPGKRDSGAGFYARIEQNPNAATAGKNRATWNFESDAQARGNIPASVRWSGKANGAPTDFGVDPVQWVSCAVLCSSATEMPYWGQASLTGGTLGYIPPTSRNTDTTENLTAQAKAAYITFYASIGADLQPPADRPSEPRITANQFKIPAGGTYGAEQCKKWKPLGVELEGGGFTNATEPEGSDWRVLQDRTTYPYFNTDFNWECNQRLWNVKSDGLWDDTDWREAVGGQKYDLRDVDCLDGTAYLDVDGEQVSFALSPASLRDPDPEGPNSTRCKTA